MTSINDMSSCVDEDQLKRPDRDIRDYYDRFESSRVMTEGSPQTLRVAYLSGPSNAAQIYEETLNRAASTYFGTNYMQQFLIIMENFAARSWIETWHGSNRYEKESGKFTFFNVPEPRIGGAIYHLSQLVKHFNRVRRIIRFKPHLLVLTGGQEYWWMYLPIKWSGTKLIASFHGAIWTRYHPLKLHERLLRALNARLSLTALDAVVHTSHEIETQFKELTGTRSSGIPVFEHLPNYLPEQFQGITPVDEVPAAPFRVLFVGRVEGNKGVFDILSVAKALDLDRPGEFAFEICGDGSALDVLRERIRQLDLQEVITCHGYCEPDAIREHMGRCHVAIVPTRADLPVGFEMTCAEAILSGRPLIASSVCPALHYLQAASIEVRPSDIAGYREAIERLRDDRALFDEKRRACSGLSDQFYDEDKSWQAAMRRALAAVFPSERRQIAGSRKAQGSRSRRSTSVLPPA